MDLEIEKTEEVTIHRFFQITVFLKGLNGIGEIILGISVFFITKSTLLSLVNLVSRVELTEDPGDLLSRYLTHAAESYTLTNQMYISVYLLIHGIVKIFLVYCLLKRYLWAYPLAMGVFGLFVVYQMYVYMHSSNISLLVLTFLDGLVILFTWLEYLRLRKNS